MTITSRISAGLVLASAMTVAFAQTVPAPGASQPGAIAVTPETARAANEKAIQRSDVATVVRTGPSTADKARHAKADMQSKTSSTTDTDGTTVATNSAADASRPPRPDRH